MQNTDKITEINEKVSHIENMMHDLDDKMEEIKGLIVEHQSHASSEHGKHTHRQGHGQH